MNPPGADPDGSFRCFLQEPGKQQPGQKERHEPKQMLPTEKLEDERFEIRERPARGLEINSRDFVVGVQRQAHRQLAALAMQPERGPPLVALADWTVAVFDVAEPRGEPNVKIGRFLRRKRLAHLRVVKFLHGGVIACVEQINHLSSDDRVAVGFFGVNTRRERLRDLRSGLPVWIVNGQTEHQKEPNSNKSDFAPKGELPKGDFEFSRFNPVAGRHCENYRAQIRDARFIQRFAGFSRMEQRLQLCFEGKKLLGYRPLIEPVDENVEGQRKQCKGDTENKSENKIVGETSPNEDDRANREWKQIPPQNRA